MYLPLQAVNAGIIDTTGWLVGLASLAFTIAWAVYLFR
jgi:hypothetical protein